MTFYRNGETHVQVVFHCFAVRNAMHEDSNFNSNNIIIMYVQMTLSKNMEVLVQSLFVLQV